MATYYKAHIFRQKKRKIGAVRKYKMQPLAVRYATAGGIFESVLGWASVFAVCVPVRCACERVEHMQGSKSFLCVMQKFVRKIYFSRSPHYNVCVCVCRDKCKFHRDNFLQTRITFNILTRHAYTYSYIGNIWN